MGIFLSKSKKAMKEIMGEGIYDVVDTVDPNFMTSEVAWIKELGGDPILMNDGENLNQMMNRLMEKSFKSPIKLLRIHGHGNPGVQRISAGLRPNPDLNTAITTDEFSTIQSALSRLTGYFSLSADVYLMGCNVAEGSKGKKLLENLANLWRVPVTGSIERQIACLLGAKTVEREACKAITFNYEGPIETAFPK